MEADAVEEGALEPDIVASEVVRDAPALPVAAGTLPVCVAPGAGDNLSTPAVMTTGTTISLYEVRTSEPCDMNVADPTATPAMPPHSARFWSGLSLQENSRDLSKNSLLVEPGQKVSPKETLT